MRVSSSIVGQQVVIRAAKEGVVPLEELQAHVRACIKENQNEHGSSTVPLRKERILNLREFRGRGAPFVVVRDMVDPTAHRIAPHPPI